MEVLELHREHDGLLHLDIKQPDLDVRIAGLIERMDLWDHIVSCNPVNADALIATGRMQLLRYKGSLYAGHGEVDPAKIAQMLERPGDGVIVDDPRGVAVALGRTGF